MTIDTKSAQIKLYVDCDDCGEQHVAEYSHVSQWGSEAVYAVVCYSTGEGLTDYYLAERLVAKRETLRTARLGNGTSVHFVDSKGILCNRWGTVSGVWKAPKFVDAAATCKRCSKIA